MKISVETIKWLLENAYANKEERYWFLKDFPKDQLPDKLVIPVSKSSKIWQSIRTYLSEKEK